VKFVFRKRSLQKSLKWRTLKICGFFRRLQLVVLEIRYNLVYIVTINKITDLLVCFLLVFSFHQNVIWLQVIMAFGMLWIVNWILALGQCTLAGEAKVD